MTDNDWFLVIGATGKQGGGVARALLRRGVAVHALVRDADSEKARVLAESGATLVTGDMDAPDTLVAAMEGAAGVFSVQNYFRVGGEAEVRQALAVLDAAEKTSVPHLIYASVGGADRSTGVAHFETKWHIEQQIAERKIPATILRPTSFMENFLHVGVTPEGEELVLHQALPNGTSMQMISVDDIGEFAAIAFANPSEYIGRAIEIAGDSRTGDELATAFGDAAGIPCRFEAISPDDLESRHVDLAAMFRWINDKGYLADIDELRTVNTALMDFPTWLAKSGWTAPTAAHV